MAAPLAFYRFWPNFYNVHAPLPSDRADFHTFFHALLQHPDVPQPTHEWRLISVFQSPRGPAGDGGVGRDPTGAVCRVSYSGEGHHNTPLADYDLNLIMRATDPATRTVCLPLFAIASHVHDYWSRYRVPRALTAPKPYFCAFVVSNGACSIRNRFVDRLSQRYQPVHSCGAALNNYGLVAPREPAAYFAFLSQFRFTVCFENRAIPEYLTEKLHNAWLGQTIPIYWGAARAQEWLNPRAFLQLPETATDAEMDAVIDRVAALDRDPAAYAAMFAEPLLRPDAPLPRAFDIAALRADIAAALKK